MAENGGNPPNTNNPSNTTNKSNVLYVVFHGLISLVDLGGDAGFKAFLLDMGTQHKYLVGDWLEETEIPPRADGSAPLEAELTGVTGGNGILDEDQSVVIHRSSGPDPTHAKVRAIISLKRPRAIHPFKLGELPPEALQGDLHSLLGQPTHVAGIQVFEYTFDRVVDVTLNSNPKPLWFCPDQLAKRTDINLAVLHIYDQPGTVLDMPLEHTRAEFNLSAQFLGVDLTLEKQAVLATPPQLLPGLLQGEVECLSRRARPFAIGVVNKARAGAPIQEVGGCGSEICAPCNAVVRLN